MKPRNRIVPAPRPHARQRRHDLCGDRLGTSTPDDPDYVAGQRHRVSLERRLSDPSRLHGDLGYSARAGAQRRSAVRHAQGCRAQGDLAADRVDLPAARLAPGRGRLAGGRYPRAIPGRDLGRAGAGVAREEPVVALRPDPAHLRSQGRPRADPEVQDRRRADQDARSRATDGPGPGRSDRGQGQGGFRREAHAGGNREKSRRGRRRPARRRPGRSPR